MEKQEKLIRALKKGNEDAFRELVDKHKHMVYVTAYGFLQEQAAAEDLSQDVFLEIFNSIETFKAKSTLSTWIYRITVNKSINEVKKQKRKARETQIDSSFQNDNNHQNDLPDDEKYTPEAINENNERKILLKKAIDSLPEKQKTAFILHKYEEMPYKKIAAIMNSSLSSVEALIHRAKINLQKELSEYYKT
ncbi:MAG: RNA polymerase sigma factor [Bacteroidales bacterium]